MGYYHQDDHMGSHLHAAHHHHSIRVGLSMQKGWWSFLSVGLSLNYFLSLASDFLGLYRKIDCIDRHSIFANNLIQSSALNCAFALRLLEHHKQFGF